MKTLRRIIKGMISKSVEWLEEEDDCQSFEDYVNESIRRDHFVVGAHEASDKEIREYERAYESLLRSYSLTKFTDALRERFSFDTLGEKYDGIHGEKDNPYYKCTVAFDDLFDTSNPDFKSICNRFNVYVSSIQGKDGMIIMTFSQRVTGDVSDKVYSKYDHLYHITTRSRLDKILKWGLQPKPHSRKAYHPERVYLLPGDISYSALKSYKKLLDGDVIVSVKLDKENRFPVYIDPDTKGIEAYYTDSFIPPSSLSAVGKMKEMWMRVFRKK